MKVSKQSMAWLVVWTFALPAYAGEDGGSVGVEDNALAAAAPEASAHINTPTDPSRSSYDLIAEADQRVTVRDGDFSLQPPPGWEVYINLPSLSLLMQVPHKQGERYQRTIQVASFSEPRYIDEVTAKEYEDVIVRKFSVASSAIEDYRIRNHMTIEMADGRQGLLFYTEFKIDDVQLMQAHILVSSQTRHYLMTYSDVAEHFENEAASQFLTEAWDAMISVKLSTKTPARFESAAYLGIAAGILVLLGLGVFGFRQWRSGREYRDFANDKDTYVDEKSGVSSIHSGVSLMTSGVSRVEANVRGKKGKKPVNEVSSVETMASRFTEIEDELSHTKDDVAV